MGAIYSAADVTIIAAAGTDPSSGLAGVSRGRGKFGDIETVSGHHIALFSIPISHQIHQTLWSSRAWTFQEAFLSKRRLYFTDRMMAFICDNNLKCENAEAERRWELKLGPLRDSLPLGRNSFDTAQKLITAYSNRTLSHDYDALNAISGALNTLASWEDPTHHIWGVPCSIMTNACGMSYLNDYSWHNPDETVIALHWYHHRSCSRRQGFPSWSTLGWTGEVCFHRDAQPIVPTESIIRVEQNGAWHSLHKLIEGVSGSLDPAVTQTTQYMEVTAQTVPYVLLKKHAPVQLRNDRDERDIWHVQIQLDQDSFVEVYPQWDIADSQLGSIGPGFCAIMDHRITEAGVPTAFQVSFLILQQYDKYCERIGYCTANLALTQGRHFVFTSADGSNEEENHNLVNKHVNITTKRTFMFG